MSDKGCQVIASTVGDIIFTREIQIESRSIQMLGQISDLTVQNAKLCFDNITSTESLQRPEVSGKRFEGRYGTGQDLHTQTSTSLQGK